MILTDLFNAIKNLREKISFHKHFKAKVTGIFLQLLKKGLRQEIPLCDKVSKAECGFLESCIYTEK